MSRRLTIALVVALVVLSSMYAIMYTPTRTPYSPLNRYWNGYSKASSDLDASISIKPSVALEEPNSTLYITVPLKPYTPSEAGVLRRFVLNGGVLVVLADRPEPANTLLRELGCSSRITGEVVLDPLTYYKVTALAIASSGGNYTVLLDVASTVEPGGRYKIICWSSRDSFIDLDGNGYYTPGEPRGPFPVAVEEHVGRGIVVIVGDPDVMINSILKINSGWIKLLEDYFGGRRVFIDVSHLNETVHDYIASRMRVYGLEALSYGAPIAPPLAVLVYYSRFRRKPRVEAAPLAAVVAASILVGYFYGFRQGLTIAAIYAVLSVFSNPTLAAAGAIASASPYTLYSIVAASPLLIYCLYRNPMYTRNALKTLAYPSLALAIIYPRSLAPLALTTLLLAYGLVYSRVASAYLELNGYLEDDAYAHLESRVNLEVRCRYRVNLECMLKAPDDSQVKLLGSRCFRTRRCVLKALFKTKYSGINTLTALVRVYDPLNIFYTKKKFLVKIPVKPLHKLAVKLALTILEEAVGGVGGITGIPPIVEYSVEKGVKPKALIGDLAGAREYQPGDNPKLIHWKKSLSYRKLIVTEREASGSGGVVVIADLTCTSYPDLDKLLYTLVYTVDKAVIEGYGSLSLYVYNRDRVLLALEKRSPRVVLKELLEKLSMLIEASSYTEASVLREGEPLISEGDLISRASRTNYTLTLSSHPASMVSSRVLFVMQSEKPVIKLIYDNQWLKHIYYVVRRSFEENGFTVLKPRFLEM